MLAVRAAGYEPVASDPRRGLIVVAARTRGARNAGARFELQLYATGWMQLRVAGPLVSPARTGWVNLPPELAIEYEAFVFELLRHLDDNGALASVDSGAESGGRP